MSKEDFKVMVIIASDLALSGYVGYLALRKCDEIFSKAFWLLDSKIHILDVDKLKLFADLYK